MKTTRHLAAVLIGVAIAAAGVMALLAFKPFSLQKAPDAAFTRLDGSTGRISELQGKVVLVNFWATSCVTCVKEMPEIVATHEKYKARGYDTLAVAMSYDPPAYVANFAASRKLPFAVAIDNTGEIARQFDGIEATPTTYLINKRGEIVKRYVGEPNFEALHALVEKLMAET